MEHQAVNEATKRLFSSVQEVCNAGYPPSAAIKKIETLFQIKLSQLQRKQIGAEMHRRYTGRALPWA